LAVQRYEEKAHHKFCSIKKSKCQRQKTPEGPRNKGDTVRTLREGGGGQKLRIDETTIGRTIQSGRNRIKGEGAQVYQKQLTEPTKLRENRRMKRAHGCLPGNSHSPWIDCETSSTGRREGKKKGSGQQTGKGARRLQGCLPGRGRDQLDNTGCPGV